MAIAIILLVPMAGTASNQVTLVLGLGANRTDRVEGYRIYYKTGSPGAPYNGTGISLGNSPVEIPVSSLADSANTNRIMVIDNGDAGTSSTGDWSFSGGTNPFGTQSLYSRQVGAAYTFQSNLSGRQDVTMWWSGWKSRCSNVPVEIYDGDMLVDRVYVDQSQNSGQWNLLGSYDFKANAGVTVVSESSECSTCVDAARFTVADEVTFTGLTAGQTYYFVAKVYDSNGNESDYSDEVIFAVDERLRIIDDGDAGTSSTGTWSVSGATDSFGKQSLYSRQVGAEYTYVSQVSGFHEVALWWTGWSSRCSDVPVEIYDGNILLDRVYVDQSQNSGQWNLLGSYDFHGDAGVTVVSDSSECSTSADAVRLAVNEKPKVIDDGDAGTSSTGTWSVSGATDAFGKQSLYSKRVGAEYTYVSQVSGFHEVALWWSGWSSRCSDVPVEIYDSDILLDRVYVDQSQNSGQWNLLGSYDFHGDAGVTIVSESSACSTCADALRFF